LGVCVLGLFPTPGWSPPFPQVPPPSGLIKLYCVEGKFLGLLTVVSNQGVFWRGPILEFFANSPHCCWPHHLPVAVYMLITLTEVLSFPFPSFLTFPFWFFPLFLSITSCPFSPNVFRRTAFICPAASQWQITNISGPRQTEAKEKRRNVKYYRSFRRETNSKGPPCIRKSTLPLQQPAS